MRNMYGLPDFRGFEEIEEINIKKSVTGNMDKYNFNQA